MVDSIHFVQTDGQVLSDNMPLEEYTNLPDMFIRVNKTANIIATIRLTDDKVVCYTYAVL